MIWRLIVITTLLTLTGCAANYDLATWQTVASQPRAEAARSSLQEDLASVDELRNAGDLRASRSLALALAAEHPADGSVLWRAARAESDAVLLHHAHEKDQRAMAALSAAEYAKRAVAAAPEDPEAAAWYAYALGGTTHLAPMMARAGHARKTERAAERALALEPANPVAHQTLAILNYRLETLPGIAKVMSFGKPKSSLSDAESHARAAYEELPSLENALLLSRILDARGEGAKAKLLQSEALAQPNTPPPDAVVRSSEALLQASDQP